MAILHVIVTGITVVSAERVASFAKKMRMCNMVLRISSAVVSNVPTRDLLVLETQMLLLKG